MNGSLTLGENIADNGGVHTSFQAYQMYAGNAPTLPATNLTNNQLFFVAFGQVNTKHIMLISQWQYLTNTGVVYIVYRGVS